MALETVQSHNRPNNRKMGAAVLIQALKKIKVSKLFSVILVELYYRFMMHCIKTRLRTYLARHEQGAIHAAEGYARVSGKAWSCHCHFWTWCDELSNRNYGCHDGFDSTCCLHRASCNIQSLEQMLFKKQILLGLHSQLQNIITK